MLGNNRRARGTDNGDKAAALEPAAAATGGAGASSVMFSAGDSSCDACVRLRFPLLSRCVHDSIDSVSNARPTEAWACVGWVQRRKMSATGMMLLRG